MLSNRQNVLNFYHHKPMDRYLTYLEGIQVFLESDFNHERPPFKKSGKCWFGVEWVWDEVLQTFIPDHQQKPVLDDICNWRDVIKWPDLDSLNWEEAVRIDQIDKVIDRENFVFSFWLAEGPFERLHSLMGFQNALMALVEEEEECKAFFEKWTEWKCKLIDYICKYYKPDIIQFHDDSGTAISTFYSVNTWKKLIKPCWAACAQAIKKNGVIAELHSCGKSQEFFTRVEDCGFDSFFIQSINDFEYIRKSVQSKMGITPTDALLEMEKKASGTGVTVKESREYFYNFVKKNIENSKYDFLMMMFPSPITLGDVSEDTVLNTVPEIYACGWDWSFKKAPEFTEMIQKRNAEIEAGMK